MAYTTIDDPSAHFHTHLYTGNSSNRSETNDANAGDFQPDWVWIKARSETKAGRIFDSNRGATKLMYPSATNSEATTATSLTSFDSDGFSLGTSDGINKNTITYVGWQWKANGGSRTTFTESGNNPAGGYQANATAGFSIIDYTGTGATGTVAHGLGITPKVAIIKDRGNSTHWIYATTTVDGSNDALYLETTGAKFDSNSDIDITFTSSNVQLANNWVDVNGDARNYIAYVFAPIQGYSKFGSYTGNGNADGPFVYTGFKPAWVMVKLSSGSGEDWHMFDSKRSTSNVVKERLIANGAAAENANDSILDFLSNGFKFRENNAGWNGNNNTYIYMAFAEHPFVSSKGVPVTAR